MNLSNQFKTEFKINSTSKVLKNLKVLGKLKVKYQKLLDKKTKKARNFIRLRDLTGLIDQNKSEVILLEDDSFDSSETALQEQASREFFAKSKK